MSRPGYAPGDRGTVISWPLRLTIVFVSSLCFLAAQPPESSGFLSIIALFLWLTAVRNLSPLTAFLVGACGGTLYGLLNAAWTAEALTGFGVSPRTALIAMGVGTVYVKGLELGIESAAIAWRAPLSPLARCLVPGAVVFLVETAISAGVWGVPWGLVGHAQIENSGVAQLAVVGGVPLVSAACVVLAAALSGVLEARKAPGTRSVALGAVLGWVMLSLLGRPLAGVFQKSLAVREAEERLILLVQPNFARRDRWIPSRQRELLDQIINQTRAKIGSMEGEPALVIWPELIVTNALNLDIELGDRLAGAAKELGVPIVAGVSYLGDRRDSPPLGYRNVAIWIDPNGDIRDSVQKSLAVPLIETVNVRWPFRRLADQVVAEAHASLVEEGPIGDEMAGDFGIAVVLCYEALFPEFAASRRDGGTRLIANLADNSWIHDPRPGEQLVAYSRYRSIEQRLPFVRVAHGGLTVVVNEFGEEIASLQPNQPGTLLFWNRLPAPVSLLEKISIISLYAFPIIVISKTRIAG